MYSWINRMWDIKKNYSKFYFLSYVLYFIIEIYLEIDLLFLFMMQ